MVNQLAHKLLLFLNTQRLEFGQQFCRRRTHQVNLRGSDLNVRRKLHLFNQQAEAP